MQPACLPWGTSHKSGRTRSGRLKPHGCLRRAGVRWRQEGKWWTERTGLGQILNGSQWEDKKMASLDL
eukprot:scaffold8127_cov363-Pinguiococcus_pyrenoidosus.AAC.1